MVNKPLWESNNEQAIENQDVVKVYRVNVQGYEYLVLKDSYGEGNMTIDFDQFKEMALTVLEKLDMLTVIRNPPK